MMINSFLLCQQNPTTPSAHTELRTYSEHLPRCCTTRAIQSVCKVRHLAPNLFKIPMTLLLYPPQLDPKSELRVISLHGHSLASMIIEHKVRGFISRLLLSFAKVRNFIESNVIIICFVASTSDGSKFDFITSPRQTFQDI